MRSSGQSSAQDLEALSVSSDPGPRNVPPPWITPGFPVALRAAMRVDTLSLGRRAKMALPSQGIRTSFRLLLPRVLEAYRAMAGANQAAFGHMTEVEEVLMLLLWMPLGRLDTARDTREACAGLNGITSGLAGQLMAALQRMHRKPAGRSLEV